MGNTSSCAPYITSIAPIKVIAGDGKMHEYLHIVRAAELMVENPGHFVCNSGYLKVGFRVPGLAADEELERQRLYFLLPMDMLYSVLTDQEMDSLSCMASNAMKNKNHSNIGRRILPVLSDHFCLFPTEAKQVNYLHAVNVNVVNNNCRMARQRSWKPALDTIEEVQ